MRARVILVVVCAFLIVEAAGAAVALGADTANQGDTDGLRAALVLAVLAAVVCVPLLSTFAARSRLRWLPAALALVAAGVAARHAAVTVWAGHHPSGAAFDGARDTLTSLDHAALPAAIVLHLVIAAVALFRRVPAGRPLANR